MQSRHCANHSQLALWPGRPAQEARAAQAAAEKQAAEAAKAGAARRLKDAESRAEALEGSLAELRGELERQVSSADARKHGSNSFATAWQRMPS